MPTFEQVIGSKVRAYKHAAVILAAMHIRLFEAIGPGRSTSGELASKLSLIPDSLDLLLDALVSIGLVARQGERYALTTVSKRYLLQESPNYCGDIVMYHQHTAPHWFSLSDILERATTHPFEKLYAQHPSFLRIYMSAMREIGCAISGKVVKSLPVRNRHGLFVDLACGPALVSATFLAQNPGWRGILIDKAPLETIVAETMKAYGVAKRFEFLRQDILALRQGIKADIVYAGLVLHEYDDPTARRFLTVMRDTTLDAGCCALAVFDPGSDRREQGRQTLFALSQLIHFGVARKPRNLQDYSHLLREVGLSTLGTRLLNTRQVSYRSRLILAARQM